MYPFAKRAFDVVGAFAGLALAAPLMAIVAIVIKLTSRGPVLFSQLRCGRAGRPFRLYKFRSMTEEAEEVRASLVTANEVTGPVFKIRGDPRVTPIGRFIRKYSIDELPQLLNVLQGDMALVGPRPPIPSEVEHYEPWQLRRLEAKPGLTCIWQVSGRSDIGFEDWVRMDIEYIDTMSFWLDLKLLLRTVPAVITARGAY
jgi:exopolysaccharide biosynthesis polyprenyl glycosylphosphotransferase